MGCHQRVTSPLAGFLKECHKEKRRKGPLSLLVIFRFRFVELQMDLCRLVFKTGDSRQPSFSIVVTIPKNVVFVKIIIQIVILVFLYDFRRLLLLLDNHCTERRLLRII